MQIWLDTINLETIRQAVNCGIVSGITTNPEILSRAPGGRVRETIDQLLALQTGPVAVQVTAQDSQGMIEQARELIAYSPRILVKIFANRNGYTAIHQCRNEAIPVLATGILQPIQTVISVNLRATYIAPYLSHMGENSRTSLESIVKILRSGLNQTKILVASLKTIDDIIFCAELGVEAITIKDGLFQQLITDDTSLQAIADRFQAAWKSVAGPTFGHFRVINSPSRSFLH